MIQNNESQARIPLEQVKYKPLVGRHCPVIKTAVKCNGLDDEFIIVTYLSYANHFSNIRILHLIIDNL